MTTTDALASIAQTLADTARELDAPHATSKELRLGAGVMHAASGELRDLVAQRRPAEGNALELAHVEARRYRHALERIANGAGEERPDVTAKVALGRLPVASLLALEHRREPTFREVLEWLRGEEADELRADHDHHESPSPAKLADELERWGRRA